MVTRLLQLLATSLTLGQLACNSYTPAADPLDGAIHLDRIGHSIPADLPGPTRRTPVRSSNSTPSQGQFGEDIDMLREIVARNWAARNRTSTPDGRTLDDVFAKLGRSGDASRDTLKAELAEALCRMGDANLRVVDSANSGNTRGSGLDVDVVTGQFVVAATDGRYQGRVAPGDLVVDVDGIPMAEYAKTYCKVPGTTGARRDLLSARSLARHREHRSFPAPRELGISRAGTHTSRVKLRWNTPPPLPCASGRPVAGRVGRLDIYSFSCGDQDFGAGLDGAIRDAGDVDHLILDLRRNIGGSAEHAKGTARRFITAPTQWTRTRKIDASGTLSPLESQSFKHDPKTRSPTLWVLVGPGCAGSCEQLAAVLATQPHATLLGQRTAGAAGESRTIELPSSGIEISVPHSEHALPGTDTLIDGRGVPVDVAVEATVADLQAGRDPVLRAALTRIQGGR